MFRCRLLLCPLTFAQQTARASPEAWLVRIVTCRISSYLSILPSYLLDTGTENQDRNQNHLASKFLYRFHKLLLEQKKSRSFKALLSLSSFMNGVKSTVFSLLSLNVKCIFVPSSIFMFVILIISAVSNLKG